MRAEDAALAGEPVRRWQAECARAGGDCAARLEAIALRLSTSRALRKGATLRLFTAVGELGYTDHGSELEHRYLGPLEAGHFHLMWQRNADGEHFVLVCDRSGEPTRLEGLPLSSPSGRHIAVVACTAGRHSVTVFSVEPMRVTPEYRFEPAGGAHYRFLRWDHDDALRLEVAPGRDAPALRQETLQRHAEGWQFGARAHRAAASDVEEHRLPRRVG